MEDELRSLVFRLLNGDGLPASARIEVAQPLEVTFHARDVLWTEDAHGVGEEMELNPFLEGRMNFGLPGRHFLTGSPVDDVDLSGSQA
jgi:hypothetical protein